MKQRKHKHKESFSILLISNTGQSNRQFHIPPYFLSLFLIILLMICAVTGWLAYQYSTSAQRDSALNGQIASLEELIAQLEDEKAAQDAENYSLTAELEALKQNIQMYTESKPADDPEKSEDDPSIPSRYPYSESGILDAAYSVDHPYLSINTQPGSSLIAAGNGTVTAVRSDDIYPVIIELDHGNGYSTYYMCMKDIDLQVAEGSQVQIGDILAAVSTENTQLDYQVLWEGEPIDPLIVLEAKG